MADFKELNSLLGEYAVPEKTETGDSGSDLHSLLGEYGDENTKTLSSPKSRKSLATDIVQDVGIGTLELPGAVTGLADIPAGLMGFDRPFSKGAEKLGEATGFQPAKWAEEAEKTAYSPERVAAEQRVSKAWEDYDTDKTGIFSAIGKTLAEPRVLAGTVLKSAPSMAAGMGLARGAKALAPTISPVVAGAGGEGAIMAGQQMEQIDESVDPQRAALASTLTGVGGGALGYAGGKVAGKLGLSDLETMAAGGEAGAKALPNYKMVPAGAIQEGLLEEAPQSALEQASQNIAEGKDVTEGMARAVTQGALAGGVMGAGTNILPSGETVATPPATDEQAATQEPDFAEVSDTRPQEPIIAGAPSDLDLRTDEEKAAERQDRFNDLSARFYGTSDTDTVVDGKQVTIPGRPKEFLAPEEKAELAELEKEFGTPIDLSTPAAPAVDTKKTEDFLNRFENAWASTGKEPTRVTKALADEATKLGVPVTPNDSPMAVVAAMRAEIQARKTPEEVAQDIGDTIVAETLAAYPDGKPGIAGKTVIAGASTKVLEPQKIAAEQKLLEQQQPIVEDQVTDLGDFEPEIPWEEYDDSIPGFEEPAPVVPLTPEELENMRIARDAKIYGIEEEPEAEASPFLQARHDANKAQQEAQDALKQQEAGEVYGGGSQQPGLRGEGERPAISGEGVSPEGQAVGDIPSTEEKTVTQPTGEANGKSPDETAQTTTQEVTEEPLPPNGYTTAVKQPTGKYKLLYVGTSNEVFPGELFTSAREAKSYLEVARVKQKERPTNITQGVTEAPEEKARKLLVSAVPSGDLSAFRGKQNTDSRAKLIEALTGQPIAKNAATNAKLVQEFYKAAGVDLNQSLAAQQKQFQAWASQAQELQEAGITEEYPIDLQAAKEAAASRFNGFRELPEDRDAQKKAYVSVKGVNIGIENPAGTKRRREWPELKDHYGFVVGVKGADGDYLDVFIQPGMTQADIDAIDTVYVVDQKNEDDSFDEHKVIIGPKTVEDAKALYLENYEPGWQGLGAITEMPFEGFKEGVESYDPRLNAMDEPIAYEPPVVEEKSAEQIEEPTETVVEQVPAKEEKPKAKKEKVSPLEKAKKALSAAKSKIPGFEDKSKAEAVELAVKAEKKFASVEVDDKAAQTKDYSLQKKISNAIVTLASGTYLPYRVQQEMEELYKKVDSGEYAAIQQRLLHGTYTKPEYRVYRGRDTQGGYNVISKGEYEYAKMLEAAEAPAETAEEKELPSREELIPPAPIEQPENKDLAVVKAKFADSVQKAYEEGELEIPQYMIALDILASDDPTVLQDIQRFVDKAFPNYGELQRVKAKGSVNMKRLLSLVGSSMYKANLADTSIKEMVQNSFDAVKAQVSKNKGLRGKGNIDILVDHSNRLIAIRDNGKGMSKSTILNAFLTVAGSNKEDLEGGLASGGFGMAKAAFLYGNERIYLRTVHNGKLSILEASGDELLSEKGGAEIEITDTDEPNGTTLIVKVPENVTIDGESRYVYFPYGYEGIDFLRKPLLNDDVAINYRDGYVDPKAFMDPTPSAGEDFDSSMIGANVVPTGRNMDLSGYDKNTTANFDWGSADIYIGKKRNKYPKHQILSAGVYQFDDSFNLRGWEKVPYDLIINVKPTVDADSASYPFNLKREGWKDLVEKDIEALKQYVKQVAMGIEAQETVDVFKNIKSLPKIEVANIGKSTGFDVADFIPKKEVPVETATATAFVPPSVTVSVGKVTGVDAKGETVTYVDVEKEKQKEKGGESSFSTEKEAPKASDFLADFGIDTSAPVYVNNTSYDYVETDPNIAVFFAELGNIMMQVKAKVSGMDMYGYKKLKDTDTFMGISIDKQYHGVHVNVPFHGIFLNPLAVKGTKLPGITQGLWETIVHEFTHIPEGNHDVGFVTEYHELSAKLASDGFDIQMRVLLGRVLNKHKASFLAAREQYESSTTKNIAKSLHEGEDGTGVASVTAQARPERGAGKPTADTDGDVQGGREATSRARFSRNAELRGAGATDLAPLFESLGRVNKLSQLSNDQLQRIDEHPDAERIRYVQDNFLDLLSELDTNNKVQIKC